MKVLLSGGGSGGPVSPVLAVASEIKKLKPQTQFLFVGTKKGPEKVMVRDAGIDFVSIPAAKLRRYFSLRNIFEPFVFAAGFMKSLSVISRFRPDVMFSAGGFVAVPVAWAARFFGCKIIIHQQDAGIGLANKLISPIANQITTAFEATAKQFYSGSGLSQKLEPRAIWVGNPVRPELTESKVDIKKFFNLHEELPILLILGGATGAIQINKLVGEILPQLVEAHQVVHQTGAGKNNIDFKHRNYHPYEFIKHDAYSAILKAAHLVIARAGLSTIAELATLGKAAIIIPMPKTHQEDNAKILEELGAAAVLKGDDVTAVNLAKLINALKFNQKWVDKLIRNIKILMPKDGALKLAEIVIKHGSK
jgi:UDP-N-acetylglucosamine--N-acetylmuramyl-(pentapeptide) pyrophosphoryl-undecaprenol N-acetylglucosamine transferase